MDWNVSFVQFALEQKAVILTRMMPTNFGFCAYKIREALLWEKLRDHLNRVAKGQK